jgi:hypothetical protein
MKMSKYTVKSIRNEVKREKISIAAEQGANLKHGALSKYQKILFLQREITVQRFEFLLDVIDRGMIVTERQAQILAARKDVAELRQKEVGDAALRATIQFNRVEQRDKKIEWLEKELRKAKAERDSFAIERDTALQEASDLKTITQAIGMALIQHPKSDVDPEEIKKWDEHLIRKFFSS